MIWKSENPRCLQRFNKSCLPVSYYSQKKAWMTGDSYFDQLNRHLSSSNHKILLFMDNAGCHPDDLSGKFSNINICFLPANTTSTLQPLDLGVIQNFKVHYRQYILRDVLSKIDECDSASDVVKSVNILVAIRWVAIAWSQVTAETIMKCFRKAGILDRELDAVSRGIEDDSDPFLEADTHTHTHTHTHTVFMMQNCSMGVNQDCIAGYTSKGETWRCFFAQVHICKGKNSKRLLTCYFCSSSPPPPPTHPPTHSIPTPTSRAPYLPSTLSMTLGSWPISSSLVVCHPSALSHR